MSRILLLLGLALVLTALPASASTTLTFEDLGSQIDYGLLSTTNYGGFTWTGSGEWLTRTFDGFGSGNYYDGSGNYNYGGLPGDQNGFRRMWDEPALNASGQNNTIADGLGSFSMADGDFKLDSLWLSTFANENQRVTFTGYKGTNQVGDAVTVDSGRAPKLVSFNWEGWLDRVTITTQLNNSETDWVAFDNLTYTSAPEPASICLIGCVAGAGAWVRRRKRSGR